MAPPKFWWYGLTGNTLNGALLKKNGVSSLTTVIVLFSMGERQSIAQKGVRAIDAGKSAPRNGSDAFSIKRQCSRSRAVNR